MAKAKDRMDHWVAKEGEGDLAENEKKNEDEKTAENIEGNAVEKDIIADEKMDEQRRGLEEFDISGSPVKS